MFGHLGIESDRHGIAKLRYDLCLDQEGLYFRFTEYGWLALCNFYKTSPHLVPLTCFPPKEGNWGMDCVATTKKEGSFFIVRIPSHDKEKLLSAAFTISFMMLPEIHLLVESQKYGELGIGDRQLFSFETGCSYEYRPHGWGMFLSISSPVARLLEEFGNTHIPQASHEMARHWFAVDKKTERERTVLSDSFEAVIRESGVPRFQTIGSCACMSVNPDEKIDGEGFSIDTHNVDAAMQQMNLLVGIACLWKFAKEELLKRAS